MLNLILFILKFVFLFLFYVLVTSIARGIFNDTFIPKTLPQTISPATIQLLNPQGNVINESIVTKEAVIGRSNKSDLKIEDDFASYSHAKIILEGQNYFLKDLKSTNGTYLNSAKVNKAKLSDGDIIAIGKTRIKFTK